MAATGSTTAVDRAGADRVRGGDPATSPARTRLAAALLLAALALATATLAWPRLQAAVLFLPVEAALERYWADRRNRPEQLDELAARAAASAARHAHPRYWAGLGQLHYLQGVDPDRALYLRREAHENAIGAFDRSLALAPMQPRAWLMRGISQDWLSRRDAGVLESLKLSIYTQRVAPTLFDGRLRLGYRWVGQMDEELLGLLRDQTLLAWRMDPRGVLQSLRSGGLDLARVAYGLGPANAPVIAEMEAALAGNAR